MTKKSINDSAPPTKIHVDLINRFSALGAEKIDETLQILLGEALIIVEKNYSPANI